MSRQNIYIVSDLHLGAPTPDASLIREKHFVKWLCSVQDHTQALYLLGDVFDFWFEYRRSVPKGYVRLLGKLAEFHDQGIEVHIFTGNHDLWYKEYLPKQVGATIHTQPIIQDFFGEIFYLAHGDGLGPGDHGYKLMKKIISHPVSRWLFTQLHPDWGIGLAYSLSGLSRNHQSNSENPTSTFLGDREYLLIHAREMKKVHPEITYFVFGHRHILKKAEVDQHSYCLFLGDWIHHFSYLQIDPQNVTLKTFPLDKASNVFS